MAIQEATFSMRATRGWYGRKSVGGVECFGKSKGDVGSAALAMEWRPSVDQMMFVSSIALAYVAGIVSRTIPNSPRKPSSTYLFRRLVLHQSGCVGMLQDGGGTVQKRGAQTKGASDSLVRALGSSRNDVIGAPFVVVGVQQQFLQRSLDFQAVVLMNQGAFLRLCNCKSLPESC